MLSARAGIFMKSLNLFLWGFLDYNLCKYRMNLGL